MVSLQPFDSGIIEKYGNNVIRYGSEYVIPIIADKDYLHYEDFMDFIVEKLECTWLFIDGFLHLNFTTRVLNFRLRDKIKVYMGFQKGYKVITDLGKNFSIPSSCTGMDKIDVDAGNRRLYIYSTLVENQFLGDVFAPILRIVPITSNNKQLYTHTFTHLQYVPIRFPLIEYIHMYLKTESGLPPAFELGTFSCTLHIRKKI
jgi:hypothetical protein